MQVRFILNATFLLVPFASALPQPKLNVMPTPSVVEFGTGQLLLQRSFSIAVEGFQNAMLERGVQRFVAELSRETGMQLKDIATGSTNPSLVIHAEHRSEAVPRLGEDESYELTVSESGAKLTAPNPLGILHGLQTFLQLVATSTNGFAVPAVTIKDQPRFAWRGLLIDVSRHFIPLNVLKRNVDGMAAVKMNVLHLHLSDNEGFRVESKRSSKLHELGSDGLYYTQNEIRDLVSYAHDRGIRVLRSSIPRPIAAHGLSGIPSSPAIPVLTPSSRAAPIPLRILRERQLTNSSTSSSPRWRRSFPMPISTLAEAK